MQKVPRNEPKKIEAEQEAVVTDKKLSVKEPVAEVPLTQPDATVAPLKVQRFARRSAQKEQRILSSFLDKGLDREDLIFLKLAYNLLDESVIPSKLAF